MGKVLGLMQSPLDPQRLYREQGESIKHHYTQTVDLPEVLLAKLNAMNISEVNLPDDTGFRDRRAVRHGHAWCPELSLG